ncbi:MAG TPA: CsgG/HfaB family protein [Gemmatimonadaceae bacterium]|nr:CsgG/HfaB family protein [Gemmatimonadaceae bacterium]
MTQLKALAATLAALTLAGAGSLHAQDSTDTRPTVAVMYFTDGAIGKEHETLAPLSGGISDMLINDLSVNEKIRVVERDNLKKLMDEQNLSASGRVDQETAVKMGKLLGAHHMVFGGFVTDGRGQIRLDARAVNVETSAIEHVETVQGKEDDLMSLIDQLAMKMTNGMHLPDLPKPVRQASEAEAKRVPFETAMLYSRALAAKDAGNTNQAVELLQRSLKEFPDYAPAQRELAKLNGGQ